MFRRIPLVTCLCAAAYWACSAGGPREGLRITAVTPAVWAAHEPTSVQITGSGFLARVQLNLDWPDRSTVDDEFVVRVGEAVQLTQVERVDETELRAQAPPMPTGEYLLTVIDPRDQTATSREPVRVVANQAGDHDAHDGGDPRPDGDPGGDPRPDGGDPGGDPRPDGGDPSGDPGGDPDPLAPLLWLAADDVDGLGSGNAGWTTGAPVNTWVDKSGNRADAEAPSGFEPTYVESALNGHPGIAFDGVDDHFELTSENRLFVPLGNTTHGFTLFVVKDSLDARDQTWLTAYGVDPADPSLEIGLQDANTWLARGQDNYQGEAGSLGPAMIMLRANNEVPSFELWENRRATLAPVAASYDFPGTTSMVLGMDWDEVSTVLTPAHLFAGTLHEVIFYNHAVTAEEQRQIEDALVARWGPLDLYADDFAVNDGRYLLDGTWAVGPDELVQSDICAWPTFVSLTTETFAAPSTASVSIRAEEICPSPGGGSTQLALLLLPSGNPNCAEMTTYVCLADYGLPDIKAGKLDQGCPGPGSNAAPTPPLGAGVTYTLEGSIDGNVLTCTISGGDLATPVEVVWIDDTGTPITSGSVGFGAANIHGRFDDVRAWME